MALDIDISHYSTGTATVAANGTTVAGQGTTWTALRKGDLFGTHVGAPVRIASVNSNTSLTLAYPWKGPAQTAAPYEIQRTPYDIGYLAAIEDLLRKLGLGALPELAQLTLTANKLLATGSTGALELADLSPYARTLLDDANARAMQSTLGLIQGRIGIGGVPSDANLCVAPGTYYAQIPSDATIANNFPTDSQGVLNVEFMLDPSNPSAPRIIQTWKSLQTPPRLFIRTISGTSVGAWTEISPVVPSNITNSQLANMATARLKGRVTSGTGAVEDLTQAQVRTFLGLSTFMNGVLNSASGDALFTSMGKAQSTGANGYLTLPGGVMIQWGVKLSAGGATGTITFPVAFPSLCASITAGFNANVAAVLGMQVVSKTTTSFNFRSEFASGGGSGATGEAFFWMAIGY